MHLFFKIDCGGNGEMEKSRESSDEFLKLIQEWIELEDRTIASADELIRKANNPFVKMRMEMIKHDSGKHKVMLQWIIDNLTKEAVHLTPDEIMPLSELLHKHLEVEAKSIVLANNALKKSQLPIVRYILSALLDDETKHHAQIIMLNDEIKKAILSVT
jgi:hypothetical protein